MFYRCSSGVQNMSSVERKHWGIDRLTTDNGVPIEKGVVEIICSSVDCMHNDKSMFDLNQTGLCSLDSIELKRRKCQNYNRDMFFLKWWWWNGDKESWENDKKKKPKRT